MVKNRIKLKQLHSNVHVLEPDNKPGSEDHPPPVPYKRGKRSKNPSSEKKEENKSKTAKEKPSGSARSRKVALRALPEHLDKRKKKTIQEQGNIKSTLPVIIPPTPRRSHRIINHEHLECLEEPEDNPCRYCCKLRTGARLVSVIRLVVMIMRILRSLIMDRDTAGSLAPSHSSANAKAYKCLYPVSLYILIPSGIEMLTGFGITILFMIAVFGNPGVKLQILFCTVYMWSSFCCPALLTSFFYMLDILIRNKTCFKHVALPVGFALDFCIIIVWGIFNGLMAKGFRNILRRASDRNYHCPCDHENGYKPEHQVNDMVGITQSTTAFATLEGPIAGTSKSAEVNAGGDK